VRYQIFYITLHYIGRKSRSWIKRSLTSRWWSWCHVGVVPVMESV